MAFTTIDDPSAYFQTALWTGSASTDTITFDGNSDLQLDWLWTKCRSTGHSHALMDTSRITNGDYLPLFADTNDVEQGVYDSELQSILSDGFTVGTQPHAGGDGKTYVGYGWKANGGSRTTFSENGNNPAGGYQANTTAGFSIVDYTGTGAQGTIAHGIGVAPTVVIIKGLSDSHSWIVGHTGLGSSFTHDLILNSNGASTDDDNAFGDTAPTSSVFTVKDAGGTNNDGQNYIAYCFAEIQGYSKFGSYTGSGNADGPFVYTGFKPAWLMYKTTGTNNWNLLDAKRSPFNVADKNFYPDTDAAEMTSTKADFLSNGFKIRTSDNQSNTDGTTYIYMAFAESPFTSSKGVPTTAR